MVLGKGRQPEFRSSEFVSAFFHHDAKAQRVEAARETVLRELAEKRSTFNAQLSSARC